MLILPALWAIAGAVVGSFVGAAVVRVSRGEGVVTGRSHCDGCGRTLRAAELIPLISFAVLKGRCQSCDAPIDRVQPLAEAAGAAIALFAWGAAGYGTAYWVQAALLAVFGWQLLLLALCDARQFYLPPAANAVLAGSALLLPASLMVQPGNGFAEMLHLVLVQIAGGALGFVLLAAPALAYRAIREREGLGAADPALLGAIGLWLGPVGVCIALLLGSAAGIAAAIALRIGGREAAADTPLPLGSLLALAGFATAIAGYWAIAS